MKKLISIFFLLGLMSCSEDFLERGSLTQLGESNFWQTEQDAILGINGIYDVLQDRVLYSGNLNAVAGIPQHDALADDVFNNYKYEGPGDFVEGRANPATGFFSSFWTSNYRGIARANSAIDKISQMTTIADAKKNELIGQARFLRALFYFNLAVYFEDAPLITQPQLLADAYVSKNTFAEISAQIIQDLEFASGVLPTRYPADQFGYATKGAALGLLARFQLYNKNYQKVADLTAEIMTLGYGLFNNYTNLFTPAGELTNEIVFSVRFAQNAAFNNGETFSATFEGIPRVNMQPMANLVRDYYFTNGQPFSTTSPLYSAANPKLNRDPRLAASIYFRNDIFLVHLNRAFNGNTATTYGQKKYIRNNISADGIGVGSPGGQDFYVIRYADVLLMRAEALTELNQLTEVYTLVNQVRARVTMPTIQNAEGAGRTQAQLRDIIRHERRVEFAFEGLRFFDVKRWGQVQQAYQRADADPVAPYNPVYRGRRSEVFPIPQSELDANKNLTQHPDWL